LLRIRLTRIGRKNTPHYRVVLAEHTAPVKGKFIEILGTYNPSVQPKQFKINLAKYDYWCKQGAQPSATVASLVKKLS